jgi:hypothetical protein
MIVGEAEIDVCHRLNQVDGPKGQFCGQLREEALLFVRKRSGKQWAMLTLDYAICCQH